MGIKGLEWRARVTAVAVAVALGGLAATTVGCSGGQEKGKVANVKPGAMPDGADWTGQYFSPLFGTLHMVQEGNLVKGAWLRPRKDQCGQLTGNVDGNLLRFDWEEHIDGLVGPNSRAKGKGYFVYSRPAGENVDDEIDGEIGKGLDEVGTPWEAIKQRNVKVDLAAAGCSSGATEVGGGDWDSENKEEGEPEEPTEPKAEPPEL
jgi:hypothetical protein